jgi:hypothetical protein
MKVLLINGVPHKEYSIGQREIWSTGKRRESIYKFHKIKYI